MCRVDYGDEEGGWLEEPHLTTAQVLLKCCECKRDIEIGEKITSFTWTYDMDDDGEPMDNPSDSYENQFCAHCKAAAKWLDKVCDGHLYGEQQIWEDLEEHWDQESPPVISLNLGRLLVGMKNQWKRRDGSRIPVETIRTWAVEGAIQAMGADV